MLVASRSKYVIPLSLWMAWRVVSRCVTTFKFFRLMLIAQCCCLPQDISVGNVINSFLKNPAKVNVQNGCDAVDACDAIECPVNSVCESQWEDHDCKCTAGNFHSGFPCIFS
jgi:hypothetical protein